MNCRRSDTTARDSCLCSDVRNVCEQLQYVLGTKHRLSLMQRVEGHWVHIHMMVSLLNFTRDGYEVCNRHVVPSACSYHTDYAYSGGAAASLAVTAIIYLSPNVQTHTAQQSPPLRDHVLCP